MTEGISLIFLHLNDVTVPKYILLSHAKLDETVLTFNEFFDLMVINIKFMAVKLFLKISMTLFSLPILVLKL